MFRVWLELSSFIFWHLDPFILFRAGGGRSNLKERGHLAKHRAESSTSHFPRSRTSIMLRLIVFFESVRAKSVFVRAAIPQCRSVGS